MAFVSVQKSGLAYLPTGASRLRPIQDKLNEVSINVLEFGAVEGDFTESAGELNDVAILNAINEVDSLGGGVVDIPGRFATKAGVTLGNGSNSSPSTIHNRITLRGIGYGASTGIINQQVSGSSALVYVGNTSSSAYVLNCAGPMYGIGVQNLELDCDSKAGRGVIVNHVTSATFERVSCRNYRAIGYDLTTRTGFPVGAAFGCGDNRFYDCYGWLDSATIAALDIIGVALNSGVSSSTDLAGQPDSARNIFIGGTFVFGTTANSHGFYLSGADNNAFFNCLPLPYGGSTLGSSVHFSQWPAAGPSAGIFPNENCFINVAAPHGITGNGGVGSSWGNVFIPLPTADAGGVVSIPTGVSAFDHTGKTYLRGVRSYISRQIGTATLNSSLQSNATTSRIDVPGLSVTLTTLSSSKLKISFSGRIAKSTAGTGNFGIALNGSFNGSTFTDVTATGYFITTSADLLLDVGAGTQTVTVQFQSSDANAVQISNAGLVVEELY